MYIPGLFKSKGKHKVSEHALHLPRDYKVQGTLVACKTNPPRLNEVEGEEFDIDQQQQ